MSELQPGMLALIVGFKKNPGNVGKIVTVKSMAYYGFVGPDGSEYGGNDGWLVTGDNLLLSKSDGSFKTSDHCYVAAQHLLPIKPEADPLDVTHKEELHA